MNLSSYTERHDQNQGNKCRTVTYRGIYHHLKSENKRFLIIKKLHGVGMSNGILESVYYMHYSHHFHT